MTSIRVIEPVSKTLIGEVEQQGVMFTGDPDAVRAVESTLGKLGATSLNELDGWTNGYVKFVMGPAVRGERAERRADWDPNKHPRGPDGKFMGLGDLSSNQLLKLRVEQKKLLADSDIPADQVWAEVDRIDAAYDAKVLEEKAGGQPAPKAKPVKGKAKAKAKPVKGKAKPSSPPPPDDELDEFELGEPVIDLDAPPPDDDLGAPPPPVIVQPPKQRPGVARGRQTVERISNAPGAKESTSLPSDWEADRLEKLESNYAWWENLPPDQQAQIRDLVAEISKQPTYVRMFPAGLGGMTRDGRMKTVHEVGGKFEGYNEGRRNYEREVMGLDSDTPVEDLPVYGYIGDIETADAYGPIAVKLKPETRERTTATVGDSLNGLVQPYGVEQLPELDDDQLMSNIYGATNTHNYLAQGSIFDYMEAQVHGGVSLDDIESVTIELDYRDLLDDVVAPETLATLRQHGVEIVIDQQPDPLEALK